MASICPYLNVQYATTGGSTEPDETYNPNTSVTLSKTSGVGVTGVSLNVHGLNTLYLDDLIVGPAGGQPTPAAPPTVTTNSASAITSSLATLGGNVTADGGASMTARGVVYSSTNSSPTIGRDIVFGSDLSYSQRHNEGSNGMPKRQFIGASKVLNRRIEQQLKKGIGRILGNL